MPLLAGDTAISEAIYLKDIGCNVSVVHRREQLRAEKILEDEAKKMGINFIWKKESICIKNKRDEDCFLPADKISPPTPKPKI